MDDIVQKITIYALPVLFAITLHEAAHAYAAKRYGDATAFMMGRMSLNPLKHIDPVGSILIPLLLAITKAPFLFGWAKPVPINYWNLKNPRKDMVWVAAAGPAANFLMALFWAILFKIAAANPDGYFYLPMSLMANAGVEINIVLMAVNLLPIPPLDGGRIAVGLLPKTLGNKLESVEPFGFYVLIGLLIIDQATGLLRMLLLPVILLAMKLVSLLVSIFL